MLCSQAQAPTLYLQIALFSLQGERRGWAGGQGLFSLQTPSGALSTELTSAGSTAGAREHDSNAPTSDTGQP